MSIRRLLAPSIAVAALAYGAVLVWFRANENSLIFAPDRSALRGPPAALHLSSQDVSLRSPNGLTLKARVIPPPSSVKADQAGWLLYLHGSSGSIGVPAYNEAWAQFHRRGLGVLALDYRGFGESEGEITEAGLYEDADTAYAYMRNTLGLSPRRILLYGFSMGAAVAIDLATRVEAAGVMLEGAWLSVPQLGAERYPYLPIDLIAQNRFASIDKIAHVLMPKLFVHARADAQVPIAHSRKLFARGLPPKSFHALGGGHGTSHTVDPSFFEAVGRFVAAQGLPVVGQSNH